MKGCRRNLLASNNAVVLSILLLSSWVAVAKLAVRVDEPKQVGAKTVVKLTLKNTFTNKIESARATVFLLNDQEKIIGQSTQWVIGGSFQRGDKDKPALGPNASTTYNFVIPSDKPFSKTKLIFNRIVLEGGKLANVNNGVEIQAAEK